MSKWKWEKCGAHEGNIDLRDGGGELLLCCETWMVTQEQMDLIAKAPLLESELAAANAENKRLRGTIGSMMGACGLPDPVEACRTAIEWGNEGLKDHIGDANDMIKDGD